MILTRDARIIFFSYSWQLNNCPEINLALFFKEDDHKLRNLVYFYNYIIYNERKKERLMIFSYFFFCFQALCHVSGAHLNPAVTAGVLITGKIPIIKGVLYVIVQCLGAIAGSAVLKVSNNERGVGTLGSSPRKSENQLAVIKVRTR